MDEIQKCRERNAALETELNKATLELQRVTRALEIETALEKVRARTINMRNSSELSETSAVLFHQLKELGINPIRAGVGIFDDANTAMELWLTTVSHSQEVIKILYYFSLYIHPVFENIIPARQENKPYAITRLKGNEVRDYYQTMSTYLPQTEQHIFHEEEFFYSFFFPQGTINVVSGQALTEEESSIMIQFAHVFGLIYTRFLDLQKAEMQTREALRQNSLDRVRAEIASMRNKDDLERITPLIWRELRLLSVPFFRCGIFIVNEQEQLVHSYLSTPEGKSLAVLHLPFDATDTTKQIVENWREKKVYKEHWDRQQFQNWVELVFDLGQITTIKQYQAGDTAPESLSLQFIPFSQGMLYIGSDEPLEYFQIDLAKSLADSFSVAYARYEDFKQLEKALADLKATQSQLIQSEKMASLGEFTAGIAHEIQNPLNFVNNFSEVNTELIEEMKEQIEKGNFNEAKSISNDVLENQQRINHHGRRADAIVKSMLQHSRTSSGQKEPTGINALADEYFRLAYHGLRAKDKDFNATMQTDFDKSVGQINIIPQDIGRVLLNIYTNAFYAVSEKKRQEGDDYEPIVTVSTKRLTSPLGDGDKIEIRIKDNGDGIPPKVLDKIFQPFFSTKPTGQGTGLGLSLSYDIVKAHGGEIKVETKEREGSEFMIQLPVT